MITVDIYFQIFSVSIFFLMLLVLVYYLIQINKLNKEIKNSENIIERIISELRERLFNQDQKLLDLDVKLNIAELRISKLFSQIVNKDTNHSRNVFNNKQSIDMISQSKYISHKKNVLTLTEKAILDNLSYKECTTNELQLSLKKTREHTSRLLNKLFLEGYIVRDDLKKPYVYRLSNLNDTTSG